MTGPKQNRKKDFELFEKIFNDNQWHPCVVNSKFDKNFWFYTVTLSPTEESLKDDEYCSNAFSLTGISDQDGTKLHDAGFILIQTQVKLYEKNHNLVGWGWSSNSKLKSLYTKTTLTFVREDEWTKYTSKQWSYRRR